MDVTTARARFEELRGGSISGPASYKEAVDALYFEVCGKHLPDCNCKNKVDDALIEIYYYLNKKNIGEIMNKTARLCKGAVLLHVPGFDGVAYNNTNLTDEVARAYLAARPDHASLFEALPEDPKEETAEEATPAPVKKTRKKK